MVFDTLSDIEIEEARKARETVKRGGSLKFMFEIKNNPQKYPNLSQFKNDVLRVLHDELGGKLPKQEPIDPRLIRSPWQDEASEQNRKDREEMQEFANTLCYKGIATLIFACVEDIYSLCDNSIAAYMQPGHLKN